MVFLGDLLSYGAGPEAVVGRVRGLMDQGGVAVCGKHGETALRGPTGWHYVNDAQAARRSLEGSEARLILLRPATSCPICLA